MSDVYMSDVYISDEMIRSCAKRFLRERGRDAPKEEVAPKTPAWKALRENWLTVVVTGLTLVVGAAVTTAAAYSAGHTVGYDEGRSDWEPSDELKFEADTGRKFIINW